MKHLLLLFSLLTAYSISHGQSGPIALWKMDSNCELTDEIASSPSNGVLIDVTQTNNRRDVANMALSFNAATSYITMGVVEKLKLANDKSISFWIYPVLSGSNKSGSIFAYGTGIIIRYEEQSSATKLKIYFGNTLYMQANLVQNDWQLVSITFKKDFSSTTSKAYYYINGVQVSESEQNKSTHDFNNSIALIGPADQNTLTNGFRGKLDDLRIYDRQLTSGEILDIALPVKLEFFRGKRENGFVELKWKTQLEENVSHFNLQKSLDGINFQNISKVDGGKYNYLAYDLSGISSPFVWYRLQIVDKDGQATFSNVIIIRSDNTIGSDEPEIKLFPNPGFKNINIIGVPLNGYISIVNNSGMIVKRQQIATGNVVDISGLASGLYYLILFDGKKRMTSKFIKQ